MSITQIARYAPQAMPTSVAPEGRRS
jgi:hypothetical protein